MTGWCRSPGVSRAVGSLRSCCCTAVAHCSAAVCYSRLGEMTLAGAALSAPLRCAVVLSVGLIVLEAPPFSMAPSSPTHPPLPAELMAAGSDLRRDREAQDLLVHSLALPLWRPTEVQQHWAVRGGQVAGSGLSHSGAACWAARQ